MSLRLRSVAIVCVGLGYAVGLQWLMTRTPPSAWSGLALLAPMLAVTAVAAWRTGRKPWAGLAVAVAAALALQAAAGGGFAPERLYLLQHIAIQLALAGVFCATLRRGSRPLITRLAARVHAERLTPGMERYTRHVTIAWTVYFVAIAALSAILYETLPFTTWATLANLLTPVALVLMFTGEYALRYRLHPEFERATMRDALRAWSVGFDRAAPPPASAQRPGAGTTPS
jgi:uncharacterized membrane protein